jgi:hypothetical protein
MTTAQLPNPAALPDTARTALIIIAVIALLILASGCVWLWIKWRPSGKGTSVWVKVGRAIGAMVMGLLDHLSTTGEHKGGSRRSRKKTAVWVTVLLALAALGTAWLRYLGKAGERTDGPEVVENKTTVEGSGNATATDHSAASTGGDAAAGDIIKPGRDLVQADT